MLEIIGHKGLLGLWIWGRPYNVGVLGWCSMREIQFFLFLTIKKENL